MLSNMRRIYLLLISVMVGSPIVAATPRKNVIIQVQVGHLDKQSMAMWNCRIRADHPAMAPFVGRIKKGWVTGEERKLAVAYHFMPQIPSIQIYALPDEEQETAVGTHKRPFIIFEDYERIRYLPDEFFLALAKTAVSICGFQFTATGLPVSDDVGREAASTQQ